MDRQVAMEMEMEMEMGEKVSVEAMVASLFREDDDDDDEVRELQAEIERLAAKAQHYSSQGPSLISSRLQTYLHHTRPDLSLDDRVDDDDDDDDHDDGGRGMFDYAFSASSFLHLLPC